MPKIRKISPKIFKIARIGLMVLGVIFLLQLILAMTSVPFWAQYYLARNLADVPDDTKTIVVMGAGGFPSEDLLMRLWYTSKLAHDFPEAKVVVTTPGHFCDSTSTVYQMYCYLLKDGIAENRILVDSVGLNTRYQALMVRKLLPEGVNYAPMVIVSSPEHIYRAVKCFRKVGFEQVSGLPTTDVELETDLRVEGIKLGSKEYIPDSGKSISLRYKFWDYLKIEINVAREYVAITYYWLQGWI